MQSDGYVVVLHDFLTKFVEDIAAEIGWMCEISTKSVRIVRKCLVEDDFAVASSILGWGDVVCDETWGNCMDETIENEEIFIRLNLKLLGEFIVEFWRNNIGIKKNGIFIIRRHMQMGCVKCT